MKKQFEQFLNKSSGHGHGEELSSSNQTAASMVSHVARSLGGVRLHGMMTGQLGCAWLGFGAAYGVTAWGVACVTCSLCLLYHAAPNPNHAQPN